MKNVLKSSCLIVGNNVVFSQFVAMTKSLIPSPVGLDREDVASKKGEKSLSTKRPSEFRSISLIQTNICLFVCNHIVFSHLVAMKMYLVPIQTTNVWRIL
jgi:hypothetical protein